MKSQYKKIFDTFFLFKQLNVSAMMPDISRGEFGVLTAIERSEQERGGKANVSDIVDMSHCSASAVSRTMRGLEQKGYIKRSVDENDRRNTSVVMTESGVAVLNETERIMDNFLEAVLDEMNYKDLEKMNHELLKLYEVCEKEIKNRKYKGRK